MENKERVEELMLVRVAVMETRMGVRKDVNLMTTTMRLWMQMNSARDIHSKMKTFQLRKKELKT